ncbi:MAG: hypothetical protein JWN70_3720, partial [Planctomycetaceae bacterium]|nr:hypothetical protein [Planctomycetaceae bacterium]
SQAQELIFATGCAIWLKPVFIPLLIGNLIQDVYCFGISAR